MEDHVNRLRRICKETYKEYLSLCRDIDTYFHRKLLQEDESFVNLMEPFKVCLDLSDSSNYLVEYYTGNGNFLKIDELSFYFLEKLFRDYLEPLDKIMKFTSRMQCRFMRFLEDLIKINPESNYINSILDKCEINFQYIRDRVINNIGYFGYSEQILVSTSTYNDENFITETVNLIGEFIKIGRLYEEE